MDLNRVHSSQSQPLFPQLGKVGLSLMVVVAVAALSHVFGVPMGKAVLAGLFSGATVLTLSQMDRLPWGKLKEALVTKKVDDKEALAAQFGCDSDIVHDIGKGPLSQQRRQALSQMAQSKDWSQPAAFSEYFDLTLQQARQVVTTVREKNLTLEGQAAAFERGDDNCFAIFAAVRAAYNMAVEGQICSDPSNSNDKSSWKASDGKASADQLAKWREQYNAFCEEVRPIMEHHREERVRRLMMPHQESGEWGPPATLQTAEITL